MAGTRAGSVEERGVRVWRLRAWRRSDHDSWTAPPSAGQRLLRFGVWAFQATFNSATGTAYVKCY